MIWDSQRSEGRIAYAWGYIACGGHPCALTHVPFGIWIWQLGLVLVPWALRAVLWPLALGGGGRRALTNAPYAFLSLQALGYRSCALNVGPLAFGLGPLRLGAIGIGPLE